MIIAVWNKKVLKAAIKPSTFAYDGNDESVPRLNISMFYYNMKASSSYFFFSKIISCNAKRSFHRKFAYTLCGGGPSNGRPINRFEWIAYRSKALGPLYKFAFECVRIRRSVRPSNGWQLQSAPSFDAVTLSLRPLDRIESHPKHFR